jgi:hypothetical protein
MSTRDEISLSSFGRDPAILKTLLDESRRKYLENDENKTLVYRGIINARSAEPCWRRCMSRPSRPLSTIVVDEAMKRHLWMTCETIYTLVRGGGTAITESHIGGVTSSMVLPARAKAIYKSSFWSIVKLNE